MKADVTVSDQQVKKMLAELADIGKRRHVLAALYQGAQVYRKEIERRVPIDSGFLKKSIAAWRVPKRYQLDANVPEARAGIVRNVFRIKRRGYRVALTGRKFKHKTMSQSRSVVNAFYAKYVEGGTSKMSAKPFIRPAYQFAQSAAFAAITANINKSVAKLSQ